MVDRFATLSNSEIAKLIDEWIKSSRDRDVLKARLIDGKTYAAIAEAFELSERRTKSIVYKAETILFQKIQ